MFAQVDAAHVGVDRAKLAANLGRRVGLGIERIEMRRPARLQHHDDAFDAARRAAVARLRLGAQDIGQRQTAQAEAADLEPGAAGDAITIARVRSGDRQHKRILPAGCLR